VNATGEREHGLRLRTARPLDPGDPRQVGSYRLLGRLGVGGMGTVYLGRRSDGATAQLVAVKVVHRELAGDATFRARFADEVAAARRVAPFCTARVLDADLTATLPYLVTEYIDGLSLADAVGDGGPLDESMLHGVALGVAAALAAIHAAGVVHRDLKPANVLLSLSGPRVIDFGISRALDAAVGRTVAGTVLGTPAWMAPEQFLGAPVGPAADVFSWASLVAYAATGRNPWGAEGPPAALAYRILHHAADLGGLDGSLRPLVEAALRKDPARRPTARDLVQSLLGTGGEAAGGTGDDPTLAATRLLQRTWSGWSSLGVLGGAGMPRRAPAGSGEANGQKQGPNGLQGRNSGRLISLLRNSGLVGAGGLLGSLLGPRDEGRGRRIADGRSPGASTASPGGTTSAPPQPTTVLPSEPATPPDHDARPWPRFPGLRPGYPPPVHPPSHPPRGYPPPPEQRPGPDRRRSRPWYRKKRHLFLLVLLILLSLRFSDLYLPGQGSSNGAGSGTAPTTGPTVALRPQIRMPVRDGQLEFVLERWRCGIPQIGEGQYAHPADGQYCLADLTVRNIGDQRRMLVEPLLAVQDTDGQWYPADTGARQYLGEQSLWDAVDPGQAVTGTAAFDIPRSSRADRLELHDSPFSDGIQLLL
jgi:hypothetical protein